jgi:hypothetical protein
MTPQNDQPNMHLSGRVLERIVDEHLRPRPRWEFVFQNCFFWGLGALAVILGALAFSAMLFEIVNAHWGLSAIAPSGFFTSFIEAVPFFWVVVLALFIFIGYLNVRRTNHGYRYSLAVIAFGAVMTSIVLGTALYMINFGRSIEEAVDRNTPFHRPVLKHLIDFHDSGN